MNLASQANKAKLIRKEMNAVLAKLSTVHNEEKEGLIKRFSKLSRTYELDYKGSRIGRERIINGIESLGKDMSSINDLSIHELNLLIVPNSKAATVH